MRAVSDITWTTQRAQALVDEIEKVIVGKREAVALVVIGLLANGHLLIEDIPGVGKTMLAKSLASALGGKYRRVQFTPDLLPADITGTSIYSQQTGQFSFREGPVFTNVLLADEINRATPKTQSSLLECMEEFQVTTDGVARTLERPFFVIATENPVEYRGTYPLPEAQLDRFLMRIHIGYPSPREERTVLDRHAQGSPLAAISPVVTTEEVLRMQAQVRDVHLDPSLQDYLDFTGDRDSRSRPPVAGSQPRASLGLMRTAQAQAAAGWPQLRAAGRREGARPGRALPPPGPETLRRGRAQPATGGERSSGRHSRTDAGAGRGRLGRGISRAFC